MTVFISYAREDRDYVDRLSANLKQKGVTVWYDKEILVGTTYPDVIVAELEKSQAVLVILSPFSINAPGVRREVLKAQIINKQILPIVIGGLKERDIPTWLIDKQYADARGELDDPLPQILKALAPQKDSLPGFAGNKHRYVPSGALSELNASIIVVPDGGSISGDKVGISSKQIGHSRVGILTSFPDEVDLVKRTRIPVRLVSLDIVPEYTIVISEGLQAELGLSSTSYDPWQLEYQNFELMPVEQLNLELTIEVPLDDAVEELERSSDLTGRLIWAGEHIDKISYESILLEISGRPYRIAQLLPAPNSEKIILEITPSTNLNIFSSSAKSGVDIVILADCSGSMGIDDLTDTSDQAPRKVWGVFSNASQQNNISRMDALRRSLMKLLQMRMRISGRVSRVALVAFTDESTVRFPRQGKGMSEIDGSSSQDLINDFKGAIGLLKAEQAGTIIGQALHFAAELLHKHGHPGNERLIVLISDGANWQPKGNDSIGEVLTGLEDPISLMAHLHGTMEVRLHAIGISNLSLFTQWMRIKHPGEQPHISMIPNHDLLTHLVEVGGGDPSRTGDTDVLEEYFSGLGQGITRKIICPRLDYSISLLPMERDIILSSGRRVNSERILSKFREEKEQLVQKVYESFLGVSEHAIALTGDAIFKPTAGIQSVSLQFNMDVIDAKGFSEFAHNLMDLVFDAISKHQNNLGIQDSIRPISLTFSTDMRNIIEQLDRYFLSGNPQNDPINLGRLALQVAGNSSVAYYDTEIWNKLQAHCLRETSVILHQLQTFLFDKIMEVENSKQEEVEIDKTAEVQFRFIG
jgi:hypothetical protein